MLSPDVLISIGVGALSSIASAVLAFGVYREKINQLETNLAAAIAESQKDRKELREEQKNFVTYRHLEAVMRPMQELLNSVQQDIRELLRAVKP